MPSVPTTYRPPSDLLPGTSFFIALTRPGMQVASQVPSATGLTV